MQMSKNSQWSTQCQPNTGTIAVWENTRQRTKVKQLSPRRQHHIQPALNQGLRECGQKPQRNISRGTWRVEDYCSFMAITATNGETGHSFWWRSGTKLTILELSSLPNTQIPSAGPDLPGVEFSLTMFEDPGCQLPESITRWLAPSVQLGMFPAGWPWELCLTSSQTCGWLV